MKKYNKEARNLEALENKFKCVVYKDTLDIYTVVIDKKRSQHEAVKVTKKEQTGWLVFMPEGVKFFGAKDIIVSRYNGSYKDLKKEGKHKPGYVPPLNEDQDFDPFYNPDLEYPRRKCSSW